jgi:hypothetical protein
MSLQGKSEEEIRKLQDQLIAKLRELNGYSGNISLQRALGWNDDLYWPVRDRLVDLGTLKRQRARGGAVGLVQVQTAQQSANASLPEAQRERELYAPVASVLRGDWGRDNRLRQQLVEITAAQGRRNTGGTWTRPDIVVAAIRLFQFLPGKFFDLISFEVKPSWSINVTAVYEALAHRRAATQAYVWFHCPAEQLDGENENLDRISEEAERHGIGMIVATTPNDYATWDLRVDAARIEPDPEYINEFITLQFSDGAKEELTAWVR